MKFCIECSLYYDYSYFSKDKNYKDGYCKRCKGCKKVKDSESYIRRRDKILKQSKNNYLENRDKILKQSKIDYLKNRDEIIYRNSEYRNNRLKDDLIFKLKHRYRSLISYSYKSKSIKKNSKTQDILGCSFEYFKLYLESKFDYWMTWENKGLYNGELNHGWDIDHIIPLSSAETEEDIVKLNHYTNLQPLCSYTNRYIKRDKKNPDD
jgi:hypothetical protein